MNSPLQFESPGCRFQPASVIFSPNREFGRLGPVRNLVFLFLFACLGGGLVLRSGAGEPSTFQLRNASQVDGSGIFAEQIIQSDASLGNLRLCDAPALGKTAVLSRSQISELLAVAAPGLVATNWSGADAVRVSRRVRSFSEADALAMLTAALQKESVKDRGELELRFARPWSTPNVPDEALTVRILDLPASGVASSFLLRFELRTERETVAIYQASLQAHLWREVWTTRSPLKRGLCVADADLARERRDLVNFRESPAEFVSGDSSLELAESIQANGIVLARAVKPRTVIRRGQVVLARVQDGVLDVSLKVEALEDGAPGQSIRVRNPVSRRDLSGRVLNDQTVIIPL